METMHQQQRTKLYIVADIDEQVCTPGTAVAKQAVFTNNATCADGLRAANAQGDSQHRVALDRRLACVRVRAAVFSCNMYGA